tara:strand:- start:843 stop:1187 length:345 start_codon:yes stop_codon:yes gene_type:complete
MNKSTRRKKRVRFKIKKNLLRNRLSIFKSNNHIYAQVINDTKGITLISASSLEKNFLKDNNLSKKEIAEKIGSEIAKRSIEKGIKSVAFDKGKYKYHGIIKIFAESARNAGLEF